MAERIFKGRTEDAEAPFLGAEFWSPGTKVAGVIVREFQTQNGKSYVLRLLKPVVLDNEEQDEVSIGNMAGFRMCLQSARLRGLLEGDKVVLECTGKTSPKKAGNSPRVNFAIEVARDMSQPVEEDVYL